MCRAAIYDEGIAARQAGKSAGGDPASLGYRFFHDEYVLDYQIATHPKPQIAFLNGITSTPSQSIFSDCGCAHRPIS